VKPLRDGERYMPRVRQVGPFGLEGPTWSKRGWNITAQGMTGPGSFEGPEAALMACGAVLHDADYAWGVLYEVRHRVNWAQDRRITVEDLVEHMPRVEEDVPTAFEVDFLTGEELDAYEDKVRRTLALIEESRRKRWATRSPRGRS